MHVRETIVHVAVLWAAALGGYHVFFPLMGFDADYSTTPIAVALYYTVWLCVSLYTFRHILKGSLVMEDHPLRILLASIGFGALIWFTVIGLAGLSPDSPGTLGTDLHPTAWYFFPKTFEILVQQLLFASLILALARHTRSLRAIATSYGIIGTIGHLALVVILWPAYQLPLFLTGAAIASAFVFPYLILRVRGGFLYSYMIHWTFYAVIVYWMRTVDALSLFT